MILKLPDSDELKGVLNSRKEYSEKLKELFLGVIESNCDNSLSNFNKDEKHIKIKDKKDLISKLTEKIDILNEGVKNGPLYSPKIDEFLSDILKNSYWVSAVGSDTPLFRMRGTDGKYKIFDKKDLFAISRNNDRFAGMNRYNISGHACLYLASSLYLAWEELRRPNFHQTNFALFKLKKECKVLDLTVAQNSNNFSLLLRAYVSLLCSVKTNDQDRHHWQYELPLRISEIVSRKILEGATDLAGIKYMSSRRFECEDFKVNDNRLASAYVFLPRTCGYDEFCEEMLKLFEMTEPLSYFYLKLHLIPFNNPTDPNINEYKGTLFYQFETILAQKPTFPCSDFIKKIKGYSH